MDIYQPIEPITTEETESTQKTSAEKKAEQSKYIKKTVRVALKKMAYVSQIANCVKYIPSPQEFTAQVVSEVVIIMGKLRDFSDRINEIMETYSNFPADYLIDTTNNIMDNLNMYSGMVTTASQNMVDALHEVNDSVDLLATNSVGILTDIITETERGDENSATRYLGKTTDKVHEGLDKTTEKIDGVVNKIDNINKNVNEGVAKAVDYINSIMIKINDSINGIFGDYLINQPSTNETIDNALIETADKFNDNTMAGSLISSTSETVLTLSKNFNIGKVTTGLIGLSVNVGLLATGLDGLPQLDMGKIMSFGKDTVSDRLREKMDDRNRHNENEKKIKENVEDNLDFISTNQDGLKLKEYKIPENYKKILEDLEEEKKKQREDLRNKRKTINRNNDVKTDTDKKSVAKEIAKRKLEAKKAKISKKLKDILLVELNRFKDDIKMFGTNIKNDWFEMERLYMNSVNEIKNFFTNEEDPNAFGSKYIDDCCDKIEDDCDIIKETLKNLTTIMTVSVSQVPAPTSFGQCFDNAMYKVLRWFESLKSIFNEFKKIISRGIDILKQVNNIVKVILNGINSLKEIKEKVLEILNIKWILDFIDTIIELFSAKCAEGKEAIENTISPVLYNETDDYEAKMNALEETISSITDENSEAAKQAGKDLEELEEKGETVISAYKSPLLNEDGTDFKGWIFYYPNIDSLYGSGHKLKKKFSAYIMKRAAKTGHRKKGGKNMLKNRTVFKLHTGVVVNGKTEYKPKAYDAFYWYTKWTTNPEDDAVEKLANITFDENGEFTTRPEGGDVVSPVMTTENGTLVELEDGRRVFVNDFGIKSGDYILVEGKKYRVK